MRAVLKKIDDFFSWVLMIGASVLLVFALITVSNAAKTGEGAFLFGYRPVFILSGSMEPYLMTNGVCLTKEVNSMDEIEVGDVITFHVQQDDEKINITHRIISIEDGIINTKGDNNYVSDDLPLTIENVDAKVIAVFNQTAWLVAKWQTTTGKVMICSFAVFIILAFCLLRSLFKGFVEKKENPEALENEAVSDQTKVSSENEVSAVSESEAGETVQPTDAPKDPSL